MNQEVINKIIRYENGDMDQDEIIDLFNLLVETNALQHLQGHYHRTAVALMDAGLLTLVDELL